MHWPGCAIAGTAFASDEWSEPGKYSPDPAFSWQLAHALRVAGAISVVWWFIPMCSVSVCGLRAVMEVPA